MHKAKYRRISAVILVISVMIIMNMSLMLSSAAKNKEYTEGDFTYTIVTKSVEIVGYSGTDTHVEVPEKIDGMEVTAIKNGAFAGTGVQYVVIPDTVTAIGKKAFDSTTACCYASEVDNSSKTKEVFGSIGLMVISAVITLIIALLIIRYLIGRVKKQGIEVEKEKKE